VAPRNSANMALTAPSTARAIMLVGPTGVGKTTTIAKLAARAALIEGKRVSLITLDNYRVGGVDQIRTFAELIGVPLRVCESPGDLTRMISDEDELTLIDTAGRSPRDVGAIKELAAAIANAPKIETHLVVAAASSATVIEDLANRYRGLNLSRLLFTKVDEIDEAPELSRAPARLSLPITWVTTGQSVPEDIEEPTSARVLELASTGLRLASSRTQAA
jgi:flagellar biosynthesis protein FlhF